MINDSGKTSFRAPCYSFGDDLAGSTTSPLLLGNTGAEKVLKAPSDGEVEGAHLGDEKHYAWLAGYHGLSTAQLDLIYFLALFLVDSITHSDEVAM